MHDSNMVTAPLPLGNVDARAAVDAYFAASYDELKRLAASQLRRAPRVAGLAASTIVHETYLRLAGGRRLQINDRDHFYCLAAKVMRQVVIDRARRLCAEKRGGGCAHHRLDEERCGAAGPAEASLAASAALAGLGRRQPRLARVVWLRFVDDLSVEATATKLGLSPRTVKRDGRRAREQLREELSAAVSATRSGTEMRYRT